MTGRLRLSFISVAALLIAFVARLSLCADTDPGLHILEYRTSNDDVRMKYSVSVPASYASFVKHPVLIYLHGYGGKYNTGWSAAEIAKSESDGWLLVSPDGRRRNQFDHVGELDFFQVLAEVKSRYAVDEDRIYLTGLSMGGHGTYRLAVRYPDVFAAVAPVAGWTYYQEFVPRFYERAVDPTLPPIDLITPSRSPYYIDPSRKANYETAGALDWAENLLHLPARIAYGTLDPTNRPENQEWFIAALDRFGYDNYVEVRVVNGGHGAGGSTTDIVAFFNGKSRAVNPSNVVYTTHRLKYGGAYWLTINGLRTTNGWARVQGTAAGQTVSVMTQETSALTMDVSRCPIGDINDPVTIVIDGYLAYSGIVGDLSSPARVGSMVSFAASFDPATYRLTGWLPLSTEPSSLRKTAEKEGPCAEAYLKPFIVIYGTSGSSVQNSLNRESAFEFAAQWNGWMILQWTSGSTVPSDRLDDWHMLPYPSTFIVDDDMLEADKLVPVTDAAAQSMNLSGYNVILYGGPESNSVAAIYESILPDDIQLTANGIAVSNRAYSGSDIRYSVIYPKSESVNEFVMFNRGYLSSLPWMGTSWGVNQTGKDFEGIAWNLSDYVVWDASLMPTSALNESWTWMDLTGQYLEAGYFDQRWRLDRTPPVTTAVYDESNRLLFFIASDNAGGSGVKTIEYQINGGLWTEYDGSPVSIPVLSGAAVTTVRARATDESLQYLYEPNTNGYQYSVETAGNIESPKTWKFNAAATHRSGEPFEYLFGVPKSPASLYDWVTVDAALAPGGPWVSCEFDFGDLSGTAVGVRADHRWSIPGRYALTATLIREVDRSTVVLSTSVIVEPPAFVTPSTPVVGQTARFNANAITSGPWDTARFDFGDLSESIVSLSPTHIYSAPGPYLVTVTLSRTDGSEETYTETVYVVEYPFISPESPFIYDAVHFDARGIPWGPWDSAAFHFSDLSETIAALSLTRVFIYQTDITVTVDVQRDIDSESATYVYTFTVFAPDLMSVSNSTVDAGGLVQFNANAIGGGPWLSATFTFGDGSLSKTGLLVSHTYDQPGDYTIVIQLRRADASVETVSAVIYVIGDPPLPPTPTLTVFRSETAFCSASRLRFRYPAAVAELFFVLSIVFLARRKRCE